MGSSRYGNQKSYRSATSSRQLTLNFAPILTQAQTDQPSKVIERIANDIDEIVRLVRFPDWQQTSVGKREVKRAFDEVKGDDFKYQC